MSSKENDYTRHDTPKKNRFIGAIEAGQTVKAAAARYGIPVSTGYKIKKKWKNTGSASNRPSSGRPPVFKKAARRLIIRTAKKSRRTPFHELANQCTFDVSTSTIRNILADAGLHRRLAKRIPVLQHSHATSRLYWAQKYAEWSMAEWGQVIFSDECYVHLGETHGRIYVTRAPGEELLEDCLAPAFKQSAVRVMVWGCIILGRKGPLVVLDYPGGRGGGMTSTRYQEQVLNAPLLEFYTHMKEEKGTAWFQQDNASCHTSKTTHTWLRDHDIPTVFHPACSPDLNPIEPVWHELKSAIRALPHLPNTVEQLKAAVVAAWEGLPIEKVDRHILKMVDRVKAVKKARGKHTKY